jgi:hypothetical protein
MDSVVFTLCGRQQGARKGYNPKRMGRPSYHSILCFEAHGQEFWHGSLRPGDAATNTGARFMVQRCLEKVSSHVARSRIRFLADPRNFGWRLAEDLDQAVCGYIIVASKVQNFLAATHHAGFQPMHFGWGSPTLSTSRSSGSRSIASSWCGAPWERILTRPIPQTA